MGDFNAHSVSWYSQTTRALAEARGTRITESLTISNLLLLNLDSATSILLHWERRILTTLNSDHLPIIVQLRSSFQINLPEPHHRTFTNLKKADWDS